MGESHNCGNIPEQVDVYESDSGWTLYFSDTGYRGFDEEVFMGMTIRIPITHCPFCGERLVE